MKKIKFVLIVSLMFLFCIPLITADTKFRREAGANRLLQGSIVGGSFTGWGSNFPQNNTYAYSRCDIDGSLYNPLGGGLLSNSLRQVVTVPTTSRIVVYDMECGIIQTIDVNDTITGSPILTDLNNDLLDEITFIGWRSIQSYQYNLTSGQFENFFFHNYSATFTQPGFFECYDFHDPSQLTELKTCMIIPEGLSLDTYTLKVNASTLHPTFHSLTFNSNPLSEASRRVGNGATSMYNGIVGTTTNSDRINDFIIPHCFGWNSAQNFLECDYLNESGHSLGIDFDLSGAGITNVRIRRNSAFIAKIGTVFRTLISTHTLGGAGTDNKWETAMYDLNGVEKFSQFTVNSNRTSNWACADYTKSGSNSCCFLSSDASGSDYLKCYDANGNQAEKVNVTGGIDFAPTFAFLDVNSSNSRMIIATVEGFHQWDGSSYVKILDSTITNASENYGSGMVLVDNSASPAYIYLDEDTGFILRNGAEIATCGDGTCQEFENAFNCFIDCNPGALEVNNTGDPCTQDSDCAFGVCEARFCVLGTTLKPCDEDADCLSGECKNGVCTRPSWWDQIDASKDAAYGDDSNTNNFIALFILIFVAGAIIIKAGNFWGTVGGIAFFVAGATFFAIVGWLSAFILLGVYLVLLIGIVFAFMLSGSSD